MSDVMQAKDCPLCENNAGLIPNGSTGTMRWQVACSSCGLATPYCSSEEDVLDLWNARPTQAPLVELLRDIASVLRDPDGAGALPTALLARIDAKLAEIEGGTDGTA